MPKTMLVLLILVSLAGCGGVDPHPLQLASSPCLHWTQGSTTLPGVVITGMHCDKR